MNEYFQAFLKYSQKHDFVTSLLIIFSCIFLYYFIKFIIKKQDDWPNLKKRHHISFSRNILIVAAIFLLFFTWKGEIKAFVLSISALTVGILVVFKEVILSFFSYFITSSNNLFKIGDILEFEDKVGRVIDRSLIYTKLSLVGTNNGKEMMIPNIYFTTNRFINLSSGAKQTKNITLHTSNKRINDKKAFIEEFLQSKSLTFKVFIDYITKDEIKFQYNLDFAELEKNNQDFQEIKNELTFLFLDKFKS